jgi:hypothetical protein
MLFIKSTLALAAACAAVFSLTMVARRKRQAPKGRRARG